MAVKTDFYALLEVDRAADRDAIDKAVRKSTSKWRKMTESSDLSMRQEAERRMENITEAKRVLLDPDQRGAYDRELQTAGVETVSPSAGADGGSNRDWLTEARKYLERNDYPSANYAAREAMQSGASGAEIWNLRARASLGMNQHQDALYEAREAHNIEQNNPNYASFVGLVYADVGNIREAMTYFEKASAIEPDNVGHKVAVLECLLDLNETSVALERARTLYRSHPSDETVTEALAVAVQNNMADTFSELNNFEYFKTEEDFTRFESLNNELQGITSGRTPFVTEIQAESAEAYRKLTKKRIFLPWVPPLTGVMAGVNPSRPVSSRIRNPFVIAVTCLMLLLFGFIGFAAGSVGILFGLVCLALIGLIVWKSWVPEWIAIRRYVKALEFHL